ncbi:MAG: hypothetical protein DPW16_11175 [Chloroflexi bacterium]|nr:hypothetical protein [Chloroflexota bacterium]
MNKKYGYPERIIPDETSSGIVAIHLKRYNFAREHLTDLRVLDVACGVGYGTASLAEVAHEVVGIDIDLTAIDYAIEHFGDKNNIVFSQGDASQLSFENNSFDAVCSFETIEHVPNANLFLKEVVRVLKPEGKFFVSTPLAKQSTQHPSNPHHVQEWDPADFQRLLQAYFSDIRLFSQLRRTTRVANWLRGLDVFKLRAYIPVTIRQSVATATGTQVMGTEKLEDIWIVSGLHRNASEIVAICSNTGVSHENV